MHEQGDDGGDHQFKETTPGILRVCKTLDVYVLRAGKKVLNLHEHKSREQCIYRHKDNRALGHSQKSFHERLVRLQRQFLAGLRQRVPNQSE